MKIVLLFLSSFACFGIGHVFADNLLSITGKSAFKHEVKKSIEDSLRDEAINRKPIGKMYTPEMFGAIADGKVHPLSEKFSSIESARKEYPGVMDLNITIDGAAFQKAVDAASKDRGEILAEKNYVVNYPVNVS
ncbi:MAG TPA: hypothetical protein PK191_01545 [Niabella sp.]|nr:hypothetical protein [Niabella sp.]HOZ97433.1 hypothetical protein [Niabella sp.]HQW15199.1 hypothetical protein [Niabella sp.]HQX20334.1 hypothetical protein [Niabella sp.]HQX42165.1 hypothetical protein [Niabella sp.]